MTLSPAAERFLRTHTRSLLHLEVLLLLRRNETVWWSPEKLAAELRVSVESVERVLEQLGANNLVDVRIANTLVYRFAPVDEGVRAILDEVAQAHYDRREQIEAVLRNRSRSSAAARTFADSFRLRHRNTDG